jgi:hypothetical protein
MEGIAAWVAADDDLPGAPETDTINRIIRETALPPSQANVVAVVVVLARAARWDAEHASARARDLWVQARLAAPVGTPLAEVTDPFTMEVHRPITAQGERQELPPLPPYVRRAHDARLAEVVEAAAAGEQDGGPGRRGPPRRS